MQDVSHKVLMLRPMQAGASGFARFHREGRQAGLQIRVRGIGQEGFQAFWHEGGGTTVLLGSAICDARGEATLTVQLPEECVPLSPGRLQALLLVENRQQPRPLMIGLCTDACAGSMLDARNACLMLCERLRIKALHREEDEKKNAEDTRKQSAINPEDEHKPTSGTTLAECAECTEEGDIRPKEEGQAKEEAGNVPALMEDIRRVLTRVNIGKRLIPRREPIVLVLTEEKAAPRKEEKSVPEEPPREIFLTAIDPLPYVQAAEREIRPDGNGKEGRKAEPKNAPAQEKTMMNAAAPASSRTIDREPVDGLPALHWPPFAQPLRGYFQRYRPTGLFSLPGWRFVCVSRQGEGLWVGRKTEGGKVSRIAYAMQGVPPETSEYQPLKGSDGKEYRVLVQRV